MLTRELYVELKQAADSMPIVSITGPRQSGKTTLVRNAFQDYKYLNLENHDTQMFAREDPRGFLSQHKGGVIIDEAQKMFLNYFHIYKHKQMK